MSSQRKLSLALISSSLLLLSACASQAPKVVEEDFPTVMAQSSANADALLQKGQRDDAVKIISDLAAKHPEKKEPWSKLARVYFDYGSYAQAIVASEEVLQRDSTDRQAKSIRIVSGLRVAAQSLRDLQGDVALKGDARSDAVGLAKVMRETLGEDILVPPGSVEKKAPAAAPRSSTPARRPKRAPAPTGDNTSGGSNPFGSLK